MSKAKYPRAFLQAIPKADLHLHLDGSLRLGTLLDLAKKEGIKLPAATEAGLRQKVFKTKYKNLGEYLQGFAFTTAVMQRAGNIERIARELAEDCLAENVCYIEVRFAPQLHKNPAGAVRAAIKGLQAAKRASKKPFNFGLILCAMRNLPAQKSLQLAKMAAALKAEGLPVVGFDLAGDESRHPAQKHQKAYQYARGRFIHPTVHAGEAAGEDSIYQAVMACKARRIGHGTSLRADGELADFIAKEDILLEVCPTSNLQTLPAIKTIKKHPLGRFLKAGLPVAICTDNRLVSNTSLTAEIALVADNFGLEPAQLRALVLAPFKHAFYPAAPAQHKAFITQIKAQYDAVAKKHSTKSPISRFL